MDAESKSAKKNKKRNKKKKLGAEATAIKGGTSSPAYLLAALKEKLDEVKASDEPVGVLQSRLLCAFIIIAAVPAVGCALFGAESGSIPFLQFNSNSNSGNINSNSIPTPVQNP